MDPVFAPPAAATDAATTDGIDLRPVTAEQWPLWFRRGQETFGRRPDEDEVRRARESFALERAIGAWEGDTLAGTAVAFEMPLCVPGSRRLPCAGVSMVTVAPTHRRRGLLRAMMRHLLEDAVYRGDVFASLYASEGRIYPRFGFGIAAPSVRIDVTGDATAMRSSGHLPRDVRLISRSEAAEVLPVLHDRIAAVTTGSVQVPQGFWRRWTWPETGERATHVAVLGDPGAERGYVAYRAAADWREGVPAAADGTLTVDFLAGIDTAAQLALWRYILSVDLMRRFTARMRPVDDPLLMALDDPLAVSVAADEPMWLRILDVRAALEGRGYAADGTLVLDVPGPGDGIGDGDGRWRLHVADGTNQVTRTDAPADLRIEATDLASAYLGAVPVRALCRVGRAEERSPGAAERADAMLRVWPAPWNGTHY